MDKLKRIFRRLTCSILRHKYYPIRKIGYKSMIVGCYRCGNFYGINHDVMAILPFDKEMCEMYERMGYKNIKKYISNDKLFNLITG